MVRPSDYDPKIVEAVLEEIAEGGNLRKSARKHGLKTTTLYDWLTRDAHSEQYARAKEARREARNDAMEEIEDWAKKKLSSNAIAFYREAKDRLKFQIGKEQSPKDSGVNVNVNTSGYAEFLAACKEPPKEGK